MGTFGTPSSYNNTGALGSATNPTTAQGLSRDRENQKAILELPGTQAWVEKTIADGVIIPTSAEIVVLPEGGASTDSLTTIVLTSDGTTTLHEGMPIRLKAANSNTITVVHGTGANNISTIDGNNVVLDTTWYLELKLINGLWVQQETSAYKIANEAKTAAEAASTPATTTSRGTARVAALADMEPGATVENGPAFLAAGSDALNALVPTFLIGSIITTYAANGYVPNGCVPTDGAEYTQTQFPSFYTDYLAAGKMITCTYTEFAAQVALTGNCGKFALDIDNQKFKVPLFKDGDSITQASSAAELGKSVKAGLPNIIANIGGAGIGATLWGTTIPSGAARGVAKGSPVAGTPSGAQLYDVDIDASRYNSIYGNSTTVTDEQVRLRHFVVVASAQNNASVFDWSNYMAGLAGKANTDLSNLTLAAKMSLLGILVMTSSITLNGTTNNTVVMTDIVTVLELEIGDVIRIDTGAYNKLHTVESITNNGSIIVNYEHAGNRGNGSLKLPDFTGQATVTRIAKWYNAPLGLGQAWVAVTGSRAISTNYINSTGRVIKASVEGVFSNERGYTLFVNGVSVMHTYNSNPSAMVAMVECTVIAGATYKIVPDGGPNYIKWVELR